MRSNAIIAKILIAAAVAFLFCSSALADDVLYALPETSGPGVNLSGTYHSSYNSVVTETTSQTNTAYNICQDFGGIYCTGYSFGGDVVNTSTSAAWNVTSLSVWIVDNQNSSILGASTASFSEPSSFASGLQLVGGPITNSTSPYGATTAVSTSYTVTAAPYSGSSDHSTNYFSPTTGKFDGVWEVSFNVTGLTIAPGEDYVFAVLDPGNTSDVSLNATLCSGDTAISPLNACASSGIDALGPGGSILGAYDYADTGPPYGTPLITSDVDVELDGTATPEPATWLLFGAGIGVLTLVRRRRR
jgi:hypothetical protein